MISKYNPLSILMTETVSFSVKFNYKLSHKWLKTSKRGKKKGKIFLLNINALIVLYFFFKLYSLQLSHISISVYFPSQIDITHNIISLNETKLNMK